MKTMHPHFEGKWALILGASSGFGAAAARALSEAGLNIFGVHMDRKGTQHLADETIADIKKNGREAVFFNMNAGDVEKRAEVLTQMKERANGRLHVLMHSLAFGALKPMVGDDTLSQAQIEMTMDIMANSLVYWTRDCANAGLFAKNSRVYAMTSAGSSRVWKSYGAVSAAKCALESYIRQLSLELAPQEVTCNAILAGVTDTPALRKIPGNEGMIETAKARNPFKRLTTPEDVAQTLVALSLPHTAFVTGNTLRVDGGENVVE